MKCLDILREYKRLYDELDKQMINPKRCFADIREAFIYGRIDEKKAAELLDMCYEMKRMKKKFLRCLLEYKI